MKALLRRAAIETTNPSNGFAFPVNEQWLRAKCCSLRDYRSMTRLALHSVSSLVPFGVRKVALSPAAAAEAGSKSGLRTFGSDAMGAVLLSAVAGYVDTAGFLALFGLFTAHITGDLVTAGTTLTDQLKMGAGTRLVMIPIFMISVAATTIFARVMRRKGNATLAPMLALMTAALTLFLLPESRCSRSQTIPTAGPSWSLEAPAWWPWEFRTHSCATHSAVIRRRPS